MMTMMVMVTKTTVCVHEETISEREQTPSRSRHCNDDNGEEEDSENGDNGEEGDKDDLVDEGHDGEGDGQD